jgi:hypothetical protein
MNTKFIYDLILPYFVGSDELRPAMQHVHGDENGFLYASDGNILIRVPKEKAGKEYPPIEGYPKAEHLIQNAFERDGNIIHTIETADLIKALANIAWMRVMDGDKCKECDGDGVVECEHCGSSHDCRECKGTGEVNKRIKEFSLLVSEDYYYCIKIAESTYRANLLQLVGIVAQMLGAEEIKYTHKDKNNFGVFSFANIDILLMPYLSDFTNATLKIK